MTVNHTIRNAIGKTLTAGTALYIDFCGLPGMADKDQVQVCQQPHTVGQLIQGSYKVTSPAIRDQRLP